MNNPHFFIFKKSRVSGLIGAEWGQKGRMGGGGGAIKRNSKSYVLSAARAKRDPICGRRRAVFFYPKEKSATQNTQAGAVVAWRSKTWGSKRGRVPSRERRM